MNDFALTDHDKASSLWVRLRAHFEDRLANARARNDVHQPDAETASLRGEIKTLKALIRLGAEKAGQ
jgi:hypothetical protein